MKNSIARRTIGTIDIEINPPIPVRTLIKNIIDKRNMPFATANKKSFFVKFI